MHKKMLLLDHQCCVCMYVCMYIYQPTIHNNESVIMLGNIQHSSTILITVTVYQKLNIKSENEKKPHKIVKEK